MFEMLWILLEFVFWSWSWSRYYWWSTDWQCDNVIV